MELGTIDIRMLGSFSIRMGDKEINDSDNRSKKVWLLLAYMICCRDRAISQDDIINLLWGDEEGSANPVNALKTMLHRLRAMLDGLGPGVGHALILRRSGSYVWNPSVRFTLDSEEFDALCQAGAAAEGSEQIHKYTGALELYQGDFLPRLATEPWVVPISSYYHELFVRAASALARTLDEAGRNDECVQICSKAVEIEPYNEELYLHLMHALIAQGRGQEAAGAYRDMSDLMFANFGVMPSQELTDLYRQAVNAINDREVSMGVVRDQLREPLSSAGALFCDYDLFKVIYHAQARGVMRSGDAVHIGLVTVSGKDKAGLSKQSLDICMENLRNTVCACLRKGDIAARCSVSQYVILLPQANYENSCMVCQRVVKTFSRQYPHSPAELRFSVQPLEPML